MNDLENFTKEIDPYNRLEQYKEEIQKLKNLGYSSKQISLFLKKYKNIKATRQAIEKQITSWNKLKKTIETKEIITKAYDEIDDDDDFFTRNLKKMNNQGDK